MAANNANLVSLLVTTALFIGMYFLLIRPSTKKKKEEDQMRNSLTVGDEVTTIGGIVGKIVSVKDEAENFIIETGSDRNKLKIKKWAIASCNKKGNC